MKIQRIHLDEVVVPSKPDSVNSPEFDRPLHMLPHAGHCGWTLQFDEIPKLILRMETDDGFTGIGEFYRGVSLRAVEELSRSLLGLDIERMNLQALPLPGGRIYDGFETAILDAVGKSLGVPLCRLLGGAYRDTVRCGYWTGHRSIADAARKAREGKEKGFDSIKFKCDLADPVAEWCEAVKDVCGPEFKVILDPNQRFENVSTARHIADDLEKAGNVLCLEDPIARWDLDSLTGLRRMITIPIALHVSLPYQELGYQHPSDVIRAIRLDACDYFNFNGGAFAVKRMATLADMAKKPFWHGSEVDLGILEAMYLHKCAACELAILPSDIFGELVREDDLITTPIRFHGAHAEVPRGSGLGVDLDLDALGQYRTRECIISPL